MDAAEIVRTIHRIASDDGQVPGERTFLAATGLTRTDLWKAGFPNYRAVVEAANLKPNQLNQPHDSAAMLAAIAKLAEALGRFPTKGDIKVGRLTDSALPSYEAFVRLGGGSYKAVRPMLRDYLQSTGTFATVLTAMGPAPQEHAPSESAQASSPQRIRGYVYLARHGQDYKIGRSNDVTRRRRELSITLPQELEHVHVIETDDPEGIEAYWHRRFSENRTRGEWFRLSASDIAAFKRRRYM